jgi:hypothetical protein
MDLKYSPARSTQSMDGLVNEQEICEGYEHYDARN